MTDPNRPATIDDLVADVTAQSDVISSVETLIGGLRTQLVAAAANAADPAAIQAVIDSLDANTARLATAVQAGTPTA